MAKTPEQKVKDRAVATLKDLGCYYFFAYTGGYGTSGVPDIVLCYRGVFVGLECKAGAKRPTPLQVAQLRAIRAAGGLAYVVGGRVPKGAEYHITPEELPALFSRVDAKLDAGA